MTHAASLLILLFFFFSLLLLVQGQVNTGQTFGLPPSFLEFTFVLGRNVNIVQLRNSIVRSSFEQEVESALAGVLRPLGIMPYQVCFF